MKNDMKAVETALFASLGNGAAALEHFTTLVKDATNTGNTDLIRYHMDRVKSKKKDQDALRRYTKVMQQVWPGCTITAKDGIKIKTSGCQVEGAVLQKLDALVADNASLRGVKFDRVFQPEKAAPAEVDYKKWAEQMKKSGKDVGLMIAALQALK